MDEDLLRFQSKDTPELDEPDAFWSSIYTNSILGNLPLAWDILITHSEIGAALHPRNHRQATMITNDVKKLEYIFHSHPICLLLTSPDPSSLISSPSLCRDLTSTWQHWNYTVKDMLSSRSDILTSIPELNNLLTIMSSGDIKSFVRILCHRDVEYLTRASSMISWRQIALYSLLYLYPPMFTRSEVVKVIRNSIDSYATQRRSNSSSEETEDTWGIYKQIANVEVGDLLKFLYENSTYIVDHSASDMNVENSEESDVPLSRNAMNTSIPLVLKTVMCMTLCHFMTMLDAAGILQIESSNSSRSFNDYDSNKQGQRSGYSEQDTTVNFYNSVVSETLTLMSDINVPIQVRSK